MNHVTYITGWAREYNYQWFVQNASRTRYQTWAKLFKPKTLSCYNILIWQTPGKLTVFRRSLFNTKWGYPHIAYQPNLGVYLESLSPLASTCPTPFSNLRKNVTFWKTVRCFELMLCLGIHSKTKFSFFTFFSILTKI